MLKNDYELKNIIDLDIPITDFKNIEEINNAKNFLLDLQQEIFNHSNYYFEIEYTSTIKYKKFRGRYFINIFENRTTLSKNSTHNDIPLMNIREVLNKNYKNLIQGYKQQILTENNNFENQDIFFELLQSIEEKFSLFYKTNNLNLNNNKLFYKALQNSNIKKKYLIIFMKIFKPFFNFDTFLFDTYNIAAYSEYAKGKLIIENNIVFNFKLKENLYLLSPDFVENEINSIGYNIYQKMLKKYDFNNISFLILFNKLMNIINYIKLELPANQWNIYLTKY